MKLNDAQFKALEPYEAYMKTAYEAKWARNPGHRALELMVQIYREALHLRAFSMDYNCGTCICNLLADLGKLYFPDKAEREALKAEKKAKKVSTTKKAKAPAKPVEVKTEEEPKTEDSAKSAE